MATLRLEGTYTALVTPFTPNGEAVDLPALDLLVEAQIAAGVSGLVPCGTTGEAPTLLDDEQIAVIQRVVAAAAGRVPILAGTGSFSTKKTVQASKAAIAAGADGVMVVMPYYNKPSQDGMRAHVLEVAAAIDRPIVLYNIPGRSVVDLSADTTARICAEAPLVVGVKDATGNVLRCQELKRRLGDRVTVMCGDDALTLAMMATGASGVISVTSNVRPREVSEVTRLLLAGDYMRARRAHLALLELHALMFVEPNPAPAKAALAAAGRMSAAVRGPLLPATEATRRQISEALGRLELESAGASAGVPAGRISSASAGGAS
jgi:4-hydroxy-tetrahydrodipicolinate synthase